MNNVIQTRVAGEQPAITASGGQPLREMTEIQRDDLVRLATQAGELKQTMLRLIAEIGRDHITCRDATAYEIVLGNRPSFVAFEVEGLLVVLVDDLLDDLESELWKASEVTDSQLQQEWRDRQAKAASQRPISGKTTSGARNLLSWICFAIERKLIRLQLRLEQVGRE